MESYQFASIFANEIINYLTLRKSQGHLHIKEKYYFKSLDQYLQTANVSEKVLSALIVEGWIQSLPSEVSTNTKIVFVSHYSQFAKYLSSLGFSAFVPERPVKDKSYMPYIFSESEIERLFAAADSIAGLRSPVFAKREFPLILRILYGCGLRLGEALSLRVGDVDLQFGVLHIRSAKGNKDRLVPMDNSLTEIMRQYIEIYRINHPRDVLLFQNCSGRQLSNGRIRAWFNATLDKAGIYQTKLTTSRRGICLHCLRHTFAVNSFRKQDLAGVDLYSVAPFLSTYMGHEKILGTQAYLHLTDVVSSDIIEQTTAYSGGLFPEVPQ